MTLFEMPQTVAAPPTAKVTERDMLDALARRHTQIVGNGDRWVRAEHVRNGTGFQGYNDSYERWGRSMGPLRTADFIAIDAWESKKHRVHGYEVKVSRSDWLSELRDPEKAEAFKRYCHHWMLAVPSPDIVRPGELPAGWGLVVMQTNGQLRAKGTIPLLEPEPMPWPIVVGFTRAVQKTAARTAAA